MNNTTKETPTILRKILNRKHQEISERSEIRSLNQLRDIVSNARPCRGFESAICDSIADKGTAVIAEIKKASPSKGLICHNFNPIEIAKNYEKSGAACLSVLTDTDFFQGSDEDLVQARNSCNLPVIRKDFIIDPYQIYEARSLGADCILLIAAALTGRQLEELNSCAKKLNMDVLIEVHNLDELKIALPLGNKLIGINNRDLHNFETSLENTYKLLGDVPSDHIVITESGIHSKEDIKSMRSRNVNAFLVGESLMTTNDPGKKLQELFFEK